MNDKPERPKGQRFSHVYLERPIDVSPLSVFSLVAAFRGSSSWKRTERRS
jgi:hypothetical protein